MPTFMSFYGGPTAAADCAKAGCEALSPKQARGFFRGSGYVLSAEDEEEDEEDEEEEQMAILMMILLLLSNMQ